MTQQPPPAPQQPHNVPYQPPEGYELRKKRKKWPWVLGAVVLLIVIISVSGGGGGNTSPSGQPGQPAAAPGAAPQQNDPTGGITYEVVSGNGRGTASITYTSGQNFNQAQENGVRLPWTKKVDLGQGLFTGASVIAQAGQGVNSITCRVKDGDEMLTENTSTGQFAVVTCAGG